MMLAARPARRSTHIQPTQLGYLQVPAVATALSLLLLLLLKVVVATAAAAQACLHQCKQWELPMWATPTGQHPSMQLQAIQLSRAS